MLLVNASVGPSSIHGLGCIVREFVPKGTVVWIFHPDVDIAYSSEQLESFSAATCEQIKHYGYQENDGTWILCGDDARFFNHSKDPTTGFDEEDQNIALRDLYPGDELTSNYHEFDRDSMRKLRSP